MFVHPRGEELKSAAEPKRLLIWQLDADVGAAGVECVCVFVCGMCLGVWRQVGAKSDWLLEMRRNLLRQDSPHCHSPKKMKRRKRTSTPVLREGK